MQNAGMDSFSFNEEVMQRAGEMVVAAQGGDPGKPHKFSGVELAARAVANYVIEKGASILAKDMGSDLAQLKKLAASEHISDC
jgi:hypothetical protein